MRHIICILILVTFASCHSTKHVTVSSDTTRDSVATSATKSSATYDAVFSRTLNVVFDSLDVWFIPPDVPTTTDKPSFIRVSAKKAAIGGEANVEAHSSTDTVATTDTVVHADEQVNVETRSDTTAVAHPPDFKWIFVIVAMFFLVKFWLSHK